jgi:hypothetical protein
MNVLDSLSAINPVDYVDAFKVLGLVLMALGVGLLIFVGVFVFRKSECDCGD